MSELESTPARPGARRRSRKVGGFMDNILNLEVTSQCIEA